jgi:hypothetical protein
VIARPRRWLHVILRGLHLAAIVALGAAILGAPVDLRRSATATLASGLAMLALDLWGDRDHLRNAAGLSVIAKLALVGWMVVDADNRVALFWLLLAWSALFAHAPASFRHAVLLPRRG